ncbi:hypothetical protein CDAR_612361 [Caerostris darwini]|uniref:Uncharacterized protein n=1 Tax=Caerostris darwini TaxID=1538125 RepID=A0AAV4SJQ4_9ARAC|nr:hypothetical protein CDAR_612361 [Caerostris darwini]
MWDSFLEAQYADEVLTYASSRHGLIVRRRPSLTMNCASTLPLITDQEKSSLLFFAMFRKISEIPSSQCKVPRVPPILVFQPECVSRGLQ